MKFREQKRNAFDINRVWKGKKKNHIVDINYSGNKLSTHYDKYYFTITTPDNNVFNSLWKNLYFDNFETCCKEAEKYLDDRYLI